MSEHQFLWSDVAAVDFFQKRRFWPTFIGAKAHEESSGTLPVFVWREQASLVESNKPPSSTDTSRPQLKRKRVHEESSAIIDDSFRTKKHRSFASKIFDWGVGVIQNFLAGIFQPKVAVPVVEAAPLTISKVRTSEELKDIIFKDLHDRPYFVGPGDVYGGDYNIYKGGDPSSTHSQGTVRVLSQPKINARDLLSFCRVQNQVAKSAVLAFMDDKDAPASPASAPSPKYLVINFKGVSDRL